MCAWCAFNSNSSFYLCRPIFCSACWHVIVTERELSRAQCATCIHTDADTWIGITDRKQLLAGFFRFAIQRSELHPHFRANVPFSCSAVPRQLGKRGMYPATDTNCGTNDMCVCSMKGYAIYVVQENCLCHCQQLVVCLCLYFGWLEGGEHRCLSCSNWVSRILVWLSLGRA